MFEEIAIKYYVKESSNKGLADYLIHLYNQ